MQEHPSRERCCRPAEHSEGFGDIIVEGLDLDWKADSFFCGLPGRRAWRCYTAFEESEEGAGAATMMMHYDGMVQLGFAATEARVRGRGIHLALLRRRIVDAIAAGSRLLFADTEEAVDYPAGPPSAAARNLVRAGFRLESVRPVWRPPAEMLDEDEEDEAEEEGSDEGELDGDHDFELEGLILASGGMSSVEAIDQKNCNKRPECARMFSGASWWFFRHPPDRCSVRSPRGASPLARVTVGHRVRFKPSVRTPSSASILATETVSALKNSSFTLAQPPNCLIGLNVGANLEELSTWSPVIPVLHR